MTSAEQFKAVLQELKSLYEQDKYNEVEGKSPLEQEQLELNHAYVLIDEIKISQSYKRLVTRTAVDPCRPLPQLAAQLGSKL